MMRKILLIASHYPPSNLTAVHRVRMFAKHLPSFGWQPIVLTVDEHYYEEDLDAELLALIPEGQHIEKVSAFRVTQPRVIGDLGLRGFFQLARRASVLIKREKIDFVLVFIPSFYLALIGKRLFKRLGVPYGIDYIDPWVHRFPGSERKFSRHWFSTLFAKWLEPWAVSHASLLMGVSEGYFKPVLARNPYLGSTVKTLAIPYGWEASEYGVLEQLNKKAYLFKQSSKLKLVYAGAFMPKSDYFLAMFFQTIVENEALFTDIEFHFIGTGKASLQAPSSSIQQLAEQYGLFERIVFEHPLRIPYFDMLIHIRESAGMFILGSTESHYTPSKLFNAFMMKVPVFALLHKECSANNLIRSSDWGEVCEFEEHQANEIFKKAIKLGFTAWRKRTASNSWLMDHQLVDTYSIKQLTASLAMHLHTLVSTKR
jgi:hypothetical protein